MFKRVLFGCSVVSALLYANVGLADTFATGSLIVPMDTTYQDSGMLRAFGLVYELLRNGVPVQWVIRPGKAHLGADFTASAVDHGTGTVISAHGYRGGPWVIDSSDAAKALPIVDAWQKANPAVAVHEVTAPFWGDVARRLVVAPTIAMHQDGNEGIARSYLQAAGIPDSTLDPTWPKTSPDMLSPAEVAGPTATNHSDGKLFDNNGNPAYCQFMSMHWSVTDATASPETVLEVREFLKNPVHFFAECQAVNAFEGAPPVGGRGNFLTDQGFQWPAPAQPKTYDFFNDSSPFAQLDGVFQSVGGSEPAYSLPAGGHYLMGGVVMIKKAGTPEGDTDVWMTGFLDGVCAPNEEGCDDNYGKVSYLGGHQYSTSLPISKNPQTQGTRLFLNSLFEAPCATAAGQPKMALVSSGPTDTADATVTFTFAYRNSGNGMAMSNVLSDQLPAGAELVSATQGYTLVGDTVSWELGSLLNFMSGEVTLTVRLPGYGTYSNHAHLAYKVGLNSFGVDSNTTSTIYDADTDADGVVDSLDTCPDNYNPTQNLQRDVLSCGTCGTVCSVANGTPTCNAGVCRIGTCQSGFSDCDGAYDNGCEHADVGQKCCDCAPANGSGVCVAGGCVINACATGFSDCDKDPSTGCEYDNASFATDPDNCGSCGTKCAFANAAASCSSGACKMGSCATNYVNIDGLDGNGCECLKLTTTDTTCDGVDDDCNGLIDDGYVPTNCGVGACAANSRCVAGQIMLCTPGPAVIEGPAGDPTCMDGSDNDCNGMSDDADPNCIYAIGDAGAGGAASSSGGSGASTAGGATASAGGAGATDIGGTTGISGSSALGAGGVYATSTSSASSGSSGSTATGATAGIGGALPWTGGTSSIVGSGTGAMLGSGGVVASAAGGVSGAQAGGTGIVTASLGGSSTLSTTGTAATAGSASHPGGSLSVAAAGSATTENTGVSNATEAAGDSSGCGCRVPRDINGRNHTAFILLGLGLLLRRRRATAF